MANYASFQFANKEDFILHRKVVTGTYTVKTGTAAYNGLFDNPVDIVNPGASFTLTIPDGAYIGQMLLVTFNGNGSSATVTVTTTTGTDYSTATTGQFTLIVWTGAVSGWLKVAGTMS
jgi:hypothetical protein